MKRKIHRVYMGSVKIRRMKMNGKLEMINDELEVLDFEFLILD